MSGGDPDPDDGSAEAAEAPPSDEAVELQRLEAEVQRMLDERFLDGLVRLLERAFKDYGHHAEDVVAEEIAQFVRRARAGQTLPKDLRAVLTWRTKLRMLDIARRGSPRYGVDPADHETPEREALRKEVFDLVKRRLDAWENQVMAMVVRLTVASAYFGADFSTEEIQDEVQDQLGHRLTTFSVWKLRQRGMERLTRDLVELLGPYAKDWIYGVVNDEAELDALHDRDEPDNEED